MREDITVAYELLDSSGQAAITGMRAQGAVKKAFQKLEEFLPDERVLALATGTDPPLSSSEKRSMGAGEGLMAIKDQATSGRLLVLTEMNFYEVRGTGRLNGNRPEGIRIRLPDITDVRVRSNRTLMRKDRFLMVDHLRGAQVETTLHAINTDNELEVFPPLLDQQVALVQGALEQQERQDRAPVLQPASTADELRKLVELRNEGILTDEEFAQEKAKLLG